MSNLSHSTSRRWSLPGLLTAYVVLQPLLDMVTSLGTQAGMAVTAGTVVRTLFVGAVFLYVLLCGAYPGKRPALIYLGLLTGYLAVFCLRSLLTGGLAYCLKNMGEALKVFYFHYAAVFLYTLYRQRRFVVSDLAMAASGTGYCVIILLAYITGTSFITYNAGYGYCGWFYAANDVSTLITLTAPLLLCLCLRRIATLNRQNWKSIFAICLALASLLFSASFIGTKLVYWGVLIYMAAAFIWLLARYLWKRQRPVLRCTLVAALLCVILLVLYPISPLNAYINDIYVPMSGDDPKAYAVSLEIRGLVEEDRGKAHAEMVEAAEGTWLGEQIKSNRLVQKVDWLLSRRLLMLAPIVHEYACAGPDTWLLGLGYVQRDSFEKDITHLIEMEGPALLLRHGIVGFLLLYVPFLALTFYLVYQFLRHFWRRLGDFTYCSVLFAVLMAFVTSMIAGHALEAPSVSLFVALLYEKLLIHTRRQNQALAQGHRLSDVSVPF